MRRAVAAAVLVLALPGCSDNPSSETLTAAEWRREANEICREIGPQVRAIRQPKALDAILPFTSAVIPLWKDEEERIRALLRPPELEAQAEALADALAELNVSLLEIHIATQRNDGTRRVDGIARGVSAARTIKLTSRELRLPACRAQRIP